MSSSAVHRFDDDCYTEGFFVHLRSWAASPAFEWKSLPQMQHACPVDVARVCLLPWARWCSTRRFPSMHPIDLLTDALQLLLLEAASSQVSGKISVFFMCLFSTSLKWSFCPPCFLFPSVSSPYKTAVGSLESDMRLTCPAQRSCHTVMSASALGVLALLSTSTSGTLSGSLGFDAGGSLNPTLYFQIWWIVACNCATEIDEILSCGECWSIHQNLWAVCWIFWKGWCKSSVLDTLILRPNMVEVVAKHVTISCMSLAFVDTKAESSA